MLKVSQVGGGGSTTWDGGPNMFLFLYEPSLRGEIRGPKRHFVEFSFTHKTIYKGFGEKTIPQLKQITSPPPSPNYIF